LIKYFFNIRRIITYMSFIALILSLTSCASQYFYNKAVKRSDKSFLLNSEDLDPSVSRAHGIDNGKTFWLNEIHYDEIEIYSRDKLKLNAYWVPNFDSNGKISNKTVILTHGYSGNGLGPIEMFGEFYYKDLGYNILSPDARGHGKSEGDYIGFGWHDRLDIIDWTDKIIGIVQNLEIKVSQEIILHGISMGAATVMMVAGEDLPQEIKLIIEDCGYTSADEILSYQLKKMYGIKNKALLKSTSKLTNEKAGYFFEEASAINQLQKATLPILFIHGEEDGFVPLYMVHSLYEAYSGPKMINIVPGAGHGLSVKVDTSGYYETVNNFISEWLNINGKI
jgi:uncharacterized protein